MNVQLKDQSIDISTKKPTIALHTKKRHDLGHRKENEGQKKCEKIGIVGGRAPGTGARGLRPHLSRAGATCTHN